MNELTEFEYNKEIRSIAADLVSEAMAEHENDHEAAEEEIHDSRLHETIDGHQWVIYYSYNLDVIKHSNNADYMADNFGFEGYDDLNTLYCNVAFWCMYADVQDELENAFDWFEAENESEEG